MTDKKEIETTAVFETSLDNIRVRLDISGYDNTRDRPVFEALVRLAAAMAAGLKEFGMDYALRVGPILLAAVTTIQSVYNSFKRIPPPGGYKQ